MVGEEWSRLRGGWLQWRVEGGGGIDDGPGDLGCVWRTEECVGQWGHRMNDMCRAQCVEARLVSGGRGNRATEIGLETGC